MAKAKEETNEEVKEKKTSTKKEVNDVKFDLDKQSKVKFFAKFIYILVRIAKVLTILLGLAVLIGIIAAPVISKNIKVENGDLMFFGERIYYVYDGNEVILKHNNDAIGAFEGNEVEVFDHLVNELGKVNTPVIFGIVEFYLVVVLGMCVVFYLTLVNVDKLFVNIHKEDTPFIEENTNLVRKIAYFVTAIAVIPYICDILASILFKSNLFHFEVDLVNIFYILVLFSISYIFEYGYELQKDTKARMYGEIK